MMDKNFDENQFFEFVEGCSEGLDVQVFGFVLQNLDFIEVKVVEGVDEIFVDGVLDDLMVDDIFGVMQIGEVVVEDVVFVDFEFILLNDFKCLQVEYVNYCCCIEEQWQVEIEWVKGEVVKGLVFVFDDFDCVVQYGDLVEGMFFVVIVEKVCVVVECFGVVVYGEKGEEFDFQCYEVIFQQLIFGVEKIMIFEVVEVGYCFGDVELCFVKVVVVVFVEQVIDGQLGLV